MLYLKGKWHVFMPGIDVSKNFFDMILGSEKEKRVIHVSVIEFRFELFWTFFNPNFFPMAQENVSNSWT